MPEHEKEPHATSFCRGSGVWMSDEEGLVFIRNSRLLYILYARICSSCTNSEGVGCVPSVCIGWTPSPSPSPAGKTPGTGARH